MLAKIRAQLLELDTSVRTIGRFEILSRLGAGGMGTVWAARDPELDRKVAIKFLHDAVDPHERLRREADGAGLVYDAPGIYKDDLDDER